MDSAGNYVVVWDSSQDGSGYGIYAQRYNAAGIAQGGEFEVNTYTTSDQHYPSVAMDATGDFVVAWQSNGQDGSNEGIYAQRYNSLGSPQGGEFRANSYTTNHQTFPSIAIDAAGDFLVAWTSDGQDGSSYGIYAQRFTHAGIAQGGEFLVNTDTTNLQYLPSVAMDLLGDSVITWQSYGQDGSGFGIYAQRYNAAGVAQGVEFKVNTYTSFNQGHSSSAMDAVGDFVITWESLAQDVSIYGIYAQRYNANGSAQGGEFKIDNNLAREYKLPSVSMDLTGDFVVTWSDYAIVPGTYARRYSSSGIAQSPQFQVNTATQFGFTNSPSVAMDASGDFVIGYVSYDGSSAGIGSQRYVATIGPIVTAVLEGAGSRVVPSADELTTSNSAFSVNFSDDLNAVPGGVNSVINPLNWILMRNGVDFSYQISGITFGFNATTNRYVAIVSFLQPLPEGAYQLIARQAIRDLTARGLDGEADGAAGGDFRRNFYVAKTLTAGAETRINSYTTGNQKVPSIAMDSTGDYVAAWESIGQDGSGYGIYAQRYNSAGVAQGSEFKVNTYTTGSQVFPAVSMDASGDFVVTWESYGQDGSNYGIYAQRYNALGAALGSEFKVNTYTTSLQRLPSVAMDAVGDFAIVWESLGQDGSSFGIYAQRYNSAGTAQGNEFAVNSYTKNSQTAPSIAMDAAGEFVIAWSSYGLDGSNSGVYEKRFSNIGISLGSEISVNTFTTGVQIRPSVAMDRAGEFAIAWQSNIQDGSGYGIYAQLYNNVGFARGGEFKVNTFTTGDQRRPSLAMDPTGEFVIAWQSDAQDGSNYGVYAQRYSTDGVAQGNEFRINTFTAISQRNPSVATDANGDFAIAWESGAEDFSGYGVYTQRYQTDVAPLLYQIEDTPLNVAAPLSIPLTAGLRAFDYDSNTWTSATIQIAINFRSDQDLLGFINTANIMGSWDPITGTLTLTGTDTVSNYRAAMQSVTYHNTSIAPNTTLVRTVDFQVSDGLLPSNTVTRDLTVMASSIPAVLSGVSGTGTYFENALPLVLASNLVIADPDSVNLASATVSFANWQGEDRVTFNNVFALQHAFTQDLVAHTATLTITGSDTLDHYQTLLRSVVYWDVSDAPNPVTRVASFAVTDGLSASNIVTRNTAVSPANDAPLLSTIEATPLAYKANDPAFPPQSISATLLVSEPDSNNLTKATVQITAGYQDDANGHDVLAFTNQLGITGSFNAATGLLTLTGASAVGNYRTALRSVTFGASGAAVSTSNRTLTIAGTDDFTPTAATSLAVTRTVTVSATNLPPGLAGIPVAALAYVRGTVPVAVAPAVVVLDLDSINLTGATIQVTTNYQSSEDVLGFTSGFGVTGSFSAAFGTLTLTGMTSLANYQTLLRSVTYKTNTASANTLSRTIGFIINDGLALSNAVTRSIALT